MRHHGYQLENEVFWNGLQNGWEKVSVNLWIELSKRSEVIFDIGANTGIFSLISKSVNPSSIIYAFEPIPKAFDHLKENIDLNHYKITAVKKAISNFNGTAEIFLPKDTDFAYSVTVNKNLGQNNSAALVIETITIDDYVSEHNIPRIDLLKIDVETHEPEVIEGYSKLIRAHQPSILIEILNEDVGSKVEELIKDMEYLYFNIDELGGVKLTEHIEKSDYYNYLLCSKEMAENLQLI